MEEFSYSALLIWIVPVAVLLVLTTVWVVTGIIRLVQWLKKKR